MTRIVIQIRVSEAQKAAMLESASFADQTLTEWVLSRCLPRPVVQSSPKPVSSVLPKKRMDFTKCKHPTLLCALEGKALCGSCREVNDG